MLHIVFFCFFPEKAQRVFSESSQRQVKPPSTQIVCPTHMVQPSLHKNTTMLAISHGSAKRPIGVLSNIALVLAGSFQTSSAISVHTIVGAMLFTLLSKIEIHREGD